jgi:Spy/CpxP family protein refolding chaperone
MIKPVLALALASLLVTSAPAQTAPPATNAPAQVGPGSSSSITPQGPKPAPDKQHQLLNGALTPKTRQTLQDAMDSARDSDTSHPPTAGK